MVWTLHGDGLNGRIPAGAGAGAVCKGLYCGDELIPLATAIVHV